MKKILFKNIWYIWIITLFLLAFIALYFRQAALSIPVYPASVIEEISSFEECVQAGFPIAESYPRQCIVPGGENFVEDISETQPVACTLDAKICPDGSAVGRTGPNCEFAPCPGE